MYCERCGSINVVRTRSTLLDRLVRLFSGQKRVTCRHCMWTAIIDWHDADDFVPQKSVVKAVDLAKP